MGYTTSAKSVKLSNTGKAPLAVSGISTTGNFAETNTCGSSLAAGKNCTISVTFSPATTGSLTGSLSVTDNSASSPQTASLTGTGVLPVTVSVTSFSFASTAVGAISAARNLTITNNQPTAILLSPAISGINPGDFVFSSATTCGTTLASNSKCLYALAFSPTATGARTATLTVTDSPDPSSPYNISLSGTGLVPVTVSEASLSLASTAIGYTSAARNITITNNQAVAIALSPVLGGADPTDFALSVSSTCGATLAAKSKCIYAIVFSPTEAGVRSAILAVNDSPDPNSPHTISLNGTGLVPVTVSATNLSFASTKVGSTSAARSVTVTNNQAVAIALNASMGGTDPTDFVLSASSTCGASLAAKSKCVYTLTFSPAAAGPRSATLSITDSPDPNSPYAITLSGTGK